MIRHLIGSKTRGRAQKTLYFPSAINTDVGVNIAWLEFGGRRKRRDTPHVASTLDHFADMGFGLIRLPITWERLQPTLNGALDETHAQLIDAFLDDCASRGLKVLIDIHNYATYYSPYQVNVSSVSGSFNVGDTVTFDENNQQARVLSVSNGLLECDHFLDVGTSIPTSGTVSNGAGATANVDDTPALTFLDFSDTGLRAAFYDLHSRMCARWKNHPALEAPDGMNEPANGGADNWVLAAQQFVNAWRDGGWTGEIYVEGYGYAAGHQWAWNNPNLHTLVDPLDLIRWSFHNYLDRDNVGDSFHFPTEMSGPENKPWGVQPAVTLDIGVERINIFWQWMTSHGFTRAHLGEQGCGVDLDFQEAFRRSLTNVRNKNIKFTAWSAGHQWGDYGYLLEPDTYQGKLRAQPQMAVMQEVWNKPQNNAPVFDEGASATIADSPVTITVYLRGYTTQDITLDLNVTGTATVSANQITLSAGANPSATYTIQDSSGSSTVTYSRADGGDVPPVRGFSVATSPIDTAEKLSVLSLTKEVGAYLGPALRAYIDDETYQDFSFTGSDTGAGIDYAAVIAYAGSSPHVALFDQSSNGNDMRPRTHTTHGHGAELGYLDLPTLVLDPDNNEPALFFDGERPEIPVAMANRTTVTLAVRARPSANGRILAWDETDLYNLNTNTFELSFDADGGTDEPTTIINVNAPLNAWSTIVATDDRTQNIGTFGSFGHRTTYLDSVQVAQTNNYHASIGMQHNKPTTCAIGWFKFYEPNIRFNGYVKSITILDDALSAVEIGVLDAQLSA